MVETGLRVLEISIAGIKGETRLSSSMKDTPTQIGDKIVINYTGKSKAIYKNGSMSTYIGLVQM